MNKPFKINYNGFKLKVRLMEDSEVINEKTLQYLRRDHQHPTIEQLKQAKWYPSGCVGDKVYEHPDRVYVVVLSEFYQGESTQQYQF